MANEMKLNCKLNITDFTYLAREEERIGKKRAAELFDCKLLDSFPAGKFTTLQAIHKYLFEDIYDFAGEIRTVNIAKGNFRFATVMYLQAALENIGNMPQSNFDEIVEKYVEMNIAHPFREGNGRSTRIWLDHILKTEIGKVVDWSTPAVARPINDGEYEIISGHRRLAAYQELGLETIPVIVRDMTDDEAVIAMVDANLQRETVLPSEKAFAFKMKLDAIKHQGKTSVQVAEKLLSVEKVAEDAGESKDQVRRYIRLTYLIPELLAMVDDGKIAFNPAVEISYLSKDEQRILLDAMDLNDCTPSHAQSIRLKKLSQEGSLDSQIIYGVMSEEKPNQKEQIKFKREDFKKYFPSKYTDEQMRKDILKGLELLRKQRERNRDAR